MMSDGPAIRPPFARCPPEFGGTAVPEWDCGALLHLAAGDHRQLLEGELAVALALVAERIVAREAGVAVILARGADRFVDPLERQVGERVGADLLRHLLNAA